MKQSEKFNAVKTKSEFPILNNSSSFYHERTRALDEAYHLFMEAFDDYAAKHNLSNEQIEHFKEQILSTYKESKALYFLESKLYKYSNHLQKMVCFAFNTPFEDTHDSSVTKLLYYNDKHRVISHE